MKTTEDQARITGDTLANIIAQQVGVTKENEAWLQDVCAEHFATALQERDRIAREEERDKAVDTINMILPLARGYVAANDYEAIKRYMDKAQDYNPPGVRAVRLY